MKVEDQGKSNGTVRQVKDLPLTRGQRPLVRLRDIRCAPDWSKAFPQSLERWTLDFGPWTLEQPFQFRVT